jgi:Na+/proline symporter
VVYSQLAYKYGFVAITLFWTTSPALFIAAWLTAPKWRRTRVMTPLGFMTQRYNMVVHQIFVWTGIPLRLVDNAIKIFSTAVFLSVAVGASWFTLEVCIATVGVIMILYTILGGQLAVIVTDFVQFVILCTAVLLLLPLTFIEVGGFGNFISGAPEGFFNLLSQPYELYDWILFLVITVMSYNATWSYAQKYNCVATEKDARKTAFMVGVLTFIGPILFFLPAMAARVILPELMEGDGSKYAYVALCMKVLPVGIMGLMVAGIFSATISTLGSDYNVLSGVLTNDFYAKKVKPDADENSLIRWGKINTIIIGTLTIVFALGINFVQGFNIYDIMVKAFGALGPAIMLPLLGGLLVKGINSRGAITGVVAGTVSGVSLVIINAVLLFIFKDEVLSNPTLSYWLKQGYNSSTILINVLVTIGGMWAGSALSKTPADEAARVSEFFAKMEVSSDGAVVKEQKADDRKSPFYAVGISLMFLGIIILVGGFLSGLDTRSLLIDGFAGGVMAGMGLAMWIKTRVPARKPEIAALPIDK